MKCEKCDFRDATENHPFYADYSLCQQCYEDELCCHYDVDTYEEVLKIRDQKQKNEQLAKDEIEKELKEMRREYNFKCLEVIQLRNELNKLKGSLKNA
jgi:hypothetical protein